MWFPLQLHFCALRDVVSHLFLLSCDFRDVFSPAFFIYLFFVYAGALRDALSNALFNILVCSQGRGYLFLTFFRGAFRDAHVFISCVLWDAVSPGFLILWKK